MTADEMRISDWSADVCSSDLLPIAVIGNEMVYRKSHVQAAGFDTFPEDTDGFLNLCQALKAKGTPAGVALGHAVLDGNAFAHSSEARRDGAEGVGPCRSRVSQ